MGDKLTGNDIFHDLRGAVTHDHDLRLLLEIHKLAHAILTIINGYLQEKGLSLRQLC